MRILIINGHPDKSSYNYALAQAYYKGAVDSGAEVTLVNLIDVSFDPILRYGYRKRMELEPDLLNVLEEIRRAEHTVWIYPMWWYGMPALMKGFFDRLFLPGLVIDVQEKKPLPIKLLKGRSGRIIMTADTPGWFDYLFMHRPTMNQIKKGILGFCGISPLKTSYIAPLKHSKDSFRQRWLQKVYNLGREHK